MQMEDHGGSGGLPPKPKELRDGDWVCPGCGNTCFAFRGECNRCKTARPSGAGGGGGRGGGRGGGFGGRGGGRPGADADDWNCGTCMNTNWAKRTRCNQCNTPRASPTAAGQREGAAGGFKELEGDDDLQEKLRRRKQFDDNDEDMYDDFGNLKKKYRNKANGEGKVEAPKDDFYQQELKAQAELDKREKEKAAKEKQEALQNSRKSLNSSDRDYDRRRDDDYFSGRSSHREHRFGRDERDDRRDYCHRRDDRHSDGRRDRDVSREREHQRGSRDRDYDRDRRDYGRDRRY